MKLLQKLQNSPGFNRAESFLVAYKCQIQQLTLLCRLFNAPNSMDVVYGSETFSIPKLFRKLELVSSYDETVDNNPPKQSKDAAHKWDRPIILQKYFITLLKKTSFRYYPLE